MIESLPIPEEGAAFAPAPPPPIPQEDAAVAPIMPHSLPEPERIVVPAAQPVRRGLLYPCLLMLCGMALIALAASMEARWVDEKPWSQALLVLDDDDEDIPPGAFEAYAYPVAVHAPSDGDTVRELMRRFAEAEGKGTDFKGHDEIAVAVVMPIDEAAPLLDSGRLPRPGAHEALAGDLVPSGTFALRDGGQMVQYEVVGRLKPTVSGFINTYMIIDDPIIETSITPEEGVRWGWVSPDGWAHMDELRPWIGKNDPEVGGGGPGEGEYSPANPENDGDDAPDTGPMDPDSPDLAPDERPHLFAEPELTPLAPKDSAGEDEKYAGVTVVQRQIRTPANVFWTTLAGLMLVAAAGYSMATRLCLRLGPARGTLLGPLFREVARRRGLWNGLHGLLYVLFFYAMLAGFLLPEANYEVIHYVTDVFSKSGDLGYIGDAYASRDILRAALATFDNNYVQQTLVMTFLLSLSGIPLGVLKTLGSFLLAGLALSPIWVDGASGYVFHSATMALEFEGYIIACFAVLVWTIRVYRTLTVSGGRLREFGGGIAVLFAAALASGMVLAVAALYEATTLILLVRG